MEDWPLAVKRKLEKHEIHHSKDDPVRLQPGVVDVSNEARQLIHEFIPIIRLPKRHLLRRSWGGLFGRALLNERGDRMCLQYLYVFTFQIGVLSHLWNLLAPIAMIGWTGLVLMLGPIGILPAGSEWLAVLTVAITLSPLLIWGLEPHLKDIFKHPAGSRLNIRPTSWLILYYMTMLIVAMAWSTSTVDPWLILYITLFLIVTIYCVSIIRAKQHAEKHDLDYLPVLIWMKREDDNWIFQRVCWPYFSKRTICLDRAILEVSPFRIRGRIIHTLKILSLEKRVNLFIDNTWGSLQLGPKGILGLSRLLATTVVLLAPLLGFLLTYNLLLTSVPLMIFVVISLLIISSLVALMDWPTELFGFTDETEVAQLTSEVLRTFWSMPDEARFPLRWKLQFPFFDEDLYFVTMDDSVARIVIDLFDSSEPDYTRLVFYGHGTPQDVRMTIEEPDETDSYRPLIFQKRLEMNHSKLVRLLNTKSVRKIREGDVFETSDVATLIQYVKQHIEGLLLDEDRDTETPASGIKFAKVTKRSIFEYLAQQRAILETSKLEDVFNLHWVVEYVEDRFGTDDRGES